MNPIAQDMRRDFASRGDLVAYLREQFPVAAAVDDHVSMMRGGRRVALAALDRIQPARYAATRNSLNGAVSRLSPYIRHGVLSLAEVRDAALRKVNRRRDVEKFINELGWRDYWQRLYLELGDGIWHDREAYKTGWQAGDYQDRLPDDIASGTTGLTCIDAFSEELRTTGYLHNHARMWMASYIVHWRRVRWQAGARWFLTHLLDGDPASNNLSWQWVASTFSHKPYIFNRENLDRYSDGRYCRICPARGRCPFEGTYEDLQARLFRPISAQVEPAKRAHNFRFPVGRQLPGTTSRRDEEGKAVVWVHGDALSPENPALQAEPAMPAIFVWDEELLRSQAISLKRVVFIYECLLELPVTIRRGDVAQQVAAFAREHGAGRVCTSSSPAPRFHQIAARLDQQFAVKIYPQAPFFDYDRPLDLRRFSRYWQVAQRYVFDETNTT